MNKEYILYLGTVKLVKDLLSFGGWANEIVDIYNAGKLIETLPETPVDVNEQFFTTVTVTLSERQVKTIGKTLKYHIEKGIVLPSPFATQAVEQFELLK